MALAAGAGCQDSRALTGTFRSTTPVVLPDVPGLEGGVHLELVLGHFGPDVAGIVRFTRVDAPFILPVPGACRCRFLVDGRVKDRQVVFAFPSPAPCDAETGTLLAARLDVSEDWDTLEGPVGRSLEGAPRWTFRRELEAGDLGEKDKECQETGEEAPALPDALEAADGTGGDP